MHDNCKKIREMVKLWHETQIGNIHKCREKQLEFSDMMWELHEEINPKFPEHQCFGDEVI